MVRKKLNINKTLLTVIGLNILQVCIILGIIIYGTLIHPASAMVNKFDNESILLIVIVFTSFLNSFFTLRDSLAIFRPDFRYQTLKESLSQVENLNKTLRAQRHDFMNHLQVVYGLMEMDEYKDAKDYIERIYNDIQKISRILKTSNAAVNALLQAKVMNAEKHGIRVNLCISSHLKDINIPSWELCRVLGNILDNSVDAMEKMETEKMLQIDIFEDVKSFGFRISNNGPQIPKIHLNKIFEPGFTTKEMKGQGIGLAIVKDIVSEHGGRISLLSSEQNTVFEIFLPK